VAVSFAWDAGLAALVAVCVFYPLAIIALALAPQPTGALGRAAAILGALSYPLYVVHAQVVEVVGSLVTGPARTPAIWVLATALAWALHKSLEPMGRRLLSRLFARRGAGEMRPAPA
jgi:peptidoglycan/LPS O-acetylase OafA/YrhL